MANIIKLRRMRWAGHVARMGKKTNVYRLLVRKPIGRPKRKRVDNIKMNFGEIDWGGVDWIGLAQNRYKWRVLICAVMNLRVS
jgi:hypothetical protein